MAEHTFHIEQGSSASVSGGGSGVVIGGAMTIAKGHGTASGSAVESHTVGGLGKATWECATIGLGATIGGLAPGTHTLGAVIGGTIGYVWGLRQWRKVHPPAR
jgi:hypothetical protein